MRCVRKNVAMIVLALAMAGVAGVSLAEQPISKEQAVALALAAHPGELVKAYRETRRGQEVWEVEIKGEDGRKWEMYYSMSGELVHEESE